MRAAILTIALILAAVLFGGLIPQGLPPEAYLDRFGESLGQIFLFMGLDDIYRTKGFLLLYAQFLLQGIHFQQAVFKFASQAGGFIGLSAQ